jgi:diaminopimelate decarboxylase
MALPVTVNSRPDLAWVTNMADRFAVRFVDGQARIDDVALETIAEAAGTPTYVYSARFIGAAHARLVDAVRRTPTSICYAVKANGSLAILRHLGRLGAGADIVSGGELQRALAAGIAPHKIVFSGVGKTDAELDLAIETGVRSINVESEGELRRLAKRATAAGKTAPVCLRVNPDVDPATHPYLATGLRESKFGIARASALQLAVETARTPGLELVGLACHIGSQIAEVDPFAASVGRVVALVQALAARGVVIRHLDLGGGFGVPYGPDDKPFDIAAWGNAVADATESLDVELVVEPGRYLVANAGVLLTRVLGTKRGEARSFVIVDAAMNDLLRPSLYGAYHAIVPARLPPADAPCEPVDIVGPVCEAGDFLARDRAFNPVADGDLLAVLSTGAYAMTMASTYNTRPLAAEVLVDGDRWAITRPRKTVQELLADERYPDWLSI